MDTLGKILNHKPATVYDWEPSSADTTEVREARGKALVDFFMSSSSCSTSEDMNASKSWSDFIKKVSNNNEWNTFAYVSLLEGTFELSTFRRTEGVAGVGEEAYNPMFKLPFYNQEVMLIKHTSLESLAKTYADILEGDFPFEYLPDPKRRLLGIMVLKKSETAWHYITLTALKEYQQGYRV
jgi:hypothetical protein